MKHWATGLGSAVDACRSIMRSRGTTSRSRSCGDKPSDAGEVLAVSAELGAFAGHWALSSGRCAVIGAMAEVPDLFERVVLVLPPGGGTRQVAMRRGWRPCRRSHALGRTPRLSSLHAAAIATIPVGVAAEWTQALGGALEVLTRSEFAERISRLITGFLNS